MLTVLVVVKLLVNMVETTLVIVIVMKYVVMIMIVADALMEKDTMEE